MVYSLPFRTPDRRDRLLAEVLLAQLREPTFSQAGLRAGVLAPPPSFGSAAVVVDRRGDGAVDPTQSGVGSPLLELEDVSLAVEQDHRRIELHLECPLGRTGAVHRGDDHGVIDAELPRGGDGRVPAPSNVAAFSQATPITWSVLPPNCCWISRW